MWWGAGVLALWIVVLIVTLVVNGVLEDPPLPLQVWGGAGRGGGASACAGRK